MRPSWKNGARRPGRGGPPTTTGTGSGKRGESQTPSSLSLHNPDVAKERKEDFGEYRSRVEPRFFTVEEIAIYLAVSSPRCTRWSDLVISGQ
jgi:hypothetical protein